MGSKKWMLAACLSLPLMGCAGLNDFHYEQTQHHRARAAWHDHGSYCAPSDYRKDYERGWKDGFYDIATGNKGCPPLVAPCKYWKPSQVLEDRDRARLAYYNGFQDGVACGLRYPQTHFLKLWTSCECPGPVCENQCCPTYGCPTGSCGVPTGLIENDYVPMGEAFEPIDGDGYWPQVPAGVPSSDSVSPSGQTGSGIKSIPSGTLPSGMIQDERKLQAAANNEAAAAAQKAAALQAAADEKKEIESKLAELQAAEQKAAAEMEKKAAAELKIKVSAEAQKAITPTQPSPKPADPQLPAVDAEPNLEVIPGPREDASINPRTGWIGVESAVPYDLSQGAGQAVSPIKAKMPIGKYEMIVDTQPTVSKTNVTKTSRGVHSSKKH